MECNACNSNIVSAILDEDVQRYCDILKSIKETFQTKYYKSDELLKKDMAEGILSGTISYNLTTKIQHYKMQV